MQKKYLLFTSHVDLISEICTTADCAQAGMVYFHLRFF